jgi:two-component system, NtrC family, nitrogen regulation sensor histidine kinase NtrY
MRYNLLKQNRILFFPAVILVVLIILSAFLQPVFLNNREKEWDKQLSILLVKNSSFIQDSFNQKSALLMSNRDQIEKEIIQTGNRSDLNSIFGVVLNKKYSVRIHIYENRNLIAWNSDPVIDSTGYSSLKEKENETFLVRNKQYVFLSLYSHINIDRKAYSLIVSVPIQKFYHLQNLPETAGDFIDSLSAKIHSDIELEYSVLARPVKDGRRYSFPLLNNYKNKIGSVSFSKTSLSTQLNSIKEDFQLVQSLLLVSLFILCCYWISGSYYQNLNVVYKYLLVCSIAIVARALLFFLEIPSSFLHNELTNASNFSSQFAFGIVRSPLEFLLTAVTLLVVAFFSYKLLLGYFNPDASRKKSFSIPDLIVILICCVLILLLWRGFGAAVKSVVMDSTIRYFKEFTLTPPLVVLLMCLNLLILGAIIFLSCASLILLAASKINRLRVENKKHLFLYSFILLQLLGWIFDTLQSEPQGTDLIRIIFFTVLFIVVYQVMFRERELTAKFLFFSIAASIVSVSLITNYNTRLEKESLKNTAYDLVRVNQNQIQFIVFQTLMQIKSNSGLEDPINDYSAKAFELWSRSLLYREGINSSIEFYDAQKKFLGGFTSITGEKLGTSASLLNDKDETRIIPFRNLYENKINVSGFTISHPDNFPSIYILIRTSLDEDHFNYSILPGLLSPEKAGISSALDIDAVRVFDYHDKNLYGSYGDVNISKTEEDKILNAVYNNANEAWIEINLNGEKNLVFALKQNTNSGDKIIALARPEKRFSWNLSDFFKIFFIHMGSIICILVLIAVAKFRLLRTRVISFRVKLSLAFLFVAIIPLLIIAFYIRGLTDEKNDEMLSRVLNEKGSQVGAYFESIVLRSDVDLKMLLEKASKDLRTNFSIYVDDNLFYSSFQSFYSAGILDSQLNPSAYNELMLQKYKGYSNKEVFEGKNYYSSYRVFNVAGKNYVIQVSSMFNQVLLPLSSDELDIFLFGIFSFVVVLIIIISTLLSGQISSPIKKLTLATRSVASGDYNVEVADNAKGEIKELVDGFNLMVRKVNQSQIDIAKFEREEAWREMAKQVAHEIKNPLTPMKLSVQQLMIAYKDKSPKFDSIFEKVTATVISQIETLKNIASEFSNFARMPRINIERIDLVMNIREALSLFQGEKLKIDFKCDGMKVFINADKDHLKRTIVNLVRNALQANATEVLMQVDIQNSNCLIRVSDNGNGIPQEVLPNVFDENFTTKKSGMGLGLSMAKKFIESIQGMIEVENTSSNGTTFLINLPLAE